MFMVVGTIVKRISRPGHRILLSPYATRGQDNSVPTTVAPAMIRVFRKKTSKGTKLSARG